MLKVLVSTSETQGLRENDFCWTNPEGELVKFGLECDSDRDNIDGRCGCRRSMTGFISLKATTTFKVAELNMTIAGYDAMLIFSENKAGRKRTVGNILTDARELLRIAELYPIGTVLEKRGSIFKDRVRH